jgi:hypothetical protein
VLLAELDVWHSRVIAPTRRVALGDRVLPVDPAPGVGGILLGAIVAANVAELDPELSDELGQLLDDLDAGRRIAQPRLRHRLQADRVGLARTTHRLVGRGEQVELVSEGEGSPASQVLAAAYAAGELAPGARRRVLTVVRRGSRWHGDVGPRLFAHLASGDGRRAWSTATMLDPDGWALDVLGFATIERPARRDVQARFRNLLMAAHPDRGGASDSAAARIADLTEARRILLAR